MAEQTPGNLSGALGGFMFGRTQGNRQLDQSIDRLQETVDKFASTLEGVAGTLGDANRRGASAASASGGGATRQSSTSMGNGGQVAFGAHAAGAHRAPGAPAVMGGGEPGKRAGNGGGFTFGGLATAVAGGGGAHAQGSAVGGAIKQSYQNNGGAAGAARVGLGAAAVGAITYTASHYGNQYNSQSMAAQYSYGGDFQPAYRGMFGNNYSATSDADAFRSGAAIAQRSGFLPTHNTFGSIRAQTNLTSLQNPGISNEQAALAVTSFQQVGTFNKMQALGINSTDRKGKPDILKIAREIISRVGGKEMFTEARQIEAAMSPAGSIGLTVQQMVGEGYIPKEAQASVMANIRTVLMAEIGGMSQRELNRHSRTMSTNKSSSDEYKASSAALQSIGIGRGLVARGREREGAARDSEAATIGGFTSAVEKSTEMLMEFRTALNSILSIPGIGAGVGMLSGGMGTLSGPLSQIPILNKLIPGVGDGPSNLSAGAASYGGATVPGAGAFGGSGPANRSASSVVYTTSVSGGGGRRGSGGSGGGAGSSYSLGAVKPWVAKAANILGKKFGIRSIGGYRASSAVSNSDHPRGLALDLMCGKSAGDGLAAYAVANAKDLNITYVIWRQRIWSINNRSWQQMSDRGSITANHYDHVHISFLASPNNPDLGGLPAGGGGVSTGNGAGENNPDNATAFSAGSAGGATGLGYSEAAMLGLGSGGSAGGGSAAGGGGAPSGGSAVGGGSAGGGGAPSYAGVNGNGGSSAQNIALGKQMAAARGWTGANWSALKQLWTKESGWRTNADNPSSSAYGIPQAMTSVHNMPKGYMTDPKVQIGWGLNYIADRYGSPSKAWGHSQQKGWYAQGEWNLRADQDARVHKGEMILPSKVAEAVRTELTAPGIRGGKGGSAPSIVFQPGAITVALSGPVSREGAKDTGTQIVDAMMEDRRIRQLMEA